MKTIGNPFVISGYEGAHFFCDRVVETEQLRHEIANGNNVYIRYYGGNDRPWRGTTTANQGAQFTTSNSKGK